MRGVRMGIFTNTLTTQAAGTSTTAFVCCDCFCCTRFQVCSYHLLPPRQFNHLPTAAAAISCWTGVLVLAFRRGCGCGCGCGFSFSFGFGDVLCSWTLRMCQEV